MAVLEAWKKSGIELEVKGLGIITHVVLRNKEMTSGSVYALRMREVKKNSKTGVRTMAIRSVCKRLTDCANRASVFNDGEIMN